MKITKQQLRQIIREELERSMDEESLCPSGLSKQSAASKQQVMSFGQMHRVI